jgi:hypothetical protein
MYIKASKILSLSLLLLLIFSCKSYYNAISLKEALNKNHAGLLKVTFNNGDEFIYENIVSENNVIYGITTKNGLEQKTELIQSDVKKVEVHNKKSSTGSNVLGIGVGIGAVVLGILMFSS